MRRFSSPALGRLIMVRLFFAYEETASQKISVSSSKLIMSLVQEIEPTHAHTFPHIFELSDR